MCFGSRGQGICGTFPDEHRGDAAAVDRALSERPGSLFQKAVGTGCFQMKILPVGFL